MATLSINLDFNGSFYFSEINKKYIIDLGMSEKEVKDLYRKIIKNIKDALLVYTVTSEEDNEQKLINLSEFLVNNGANINTTISYDTPLVESMSDFEEKIFRPELIKWLANNGASVKGSESGTAPICLACKYNNLDIIKFLVSKGSSVDELNGDNNLTTLMEACDGGCSLDLIKYLVENGADINFKPKGDKTALMKACSNCDIKVVKYLIDNGADIDVQDSYGLTALAYAMEAGKKDIVELIKKKKFP